jgi:hypothetical protein
LVQNSQINGEAIRKHLEDQGLVIDRHYINKLINEIHAERAKRASTWMLNHALASLQDQMSEIVKSSWEIVNDPMARNVDRTLAMRAIREAHNLIFEKLFDAGVFERKLGTLGRSSPELRPRRHDPQHATDGRTETGDPV